MGQVLINVAKIAAGLSQFSDPGLRCISGHVALFGDDLPERGIHIARHPLCVSADVKMSAGGQPRPEFGGVGQHKVLNIDLLLLIARKGEIEFREQARVDEIAKLLLVEKVGRAMLITEEEPVSAAGPGRASLFEERSKRGDSRSRTDHDHR